ncbi:MAG: hypothetical protein EON93_25960 [Burkholderiales bacterium]|nr:MAG: hypothetical protein EON93_25960 [Burkholderiales bacterium]
MDIRLIWLAVGTFAIGVESFAISSLLPQIADSTGATLTQAGYLVLAFALANALAPLFLLRSVVWQIVAAL